MPSTTQLTDPQDLPADRGSSSERRIWEEGQIGFNYYDGLAGTVTRAPDDSGWFTVKHEDGSTALLNNQRFITLATARLYGHLR